LLGERLEWPQVLGMALVLGAILTPRAARWAHDAVRRRAVEGMAA
jgi:drug/metabolite transporter (DMT)-like permease